MPPIRHSSLRIGLAAFFWISLLCCAARGSAVASADQMETIRQWLPDPNAPLNLLFEFEPESAGGDAPDAKTLHDLIDRVGPTLVVLKARRPYDEQPRLIGGYNPSKWRSWFGRYEQSPGRFIFDVDRGQKWERQTPRAGHQSLNPRHYGLQFGRGDLMIFSNLATGSARNSDFASPSEASVLLGDSGPFSIEGLAVYHVVSQPVPNGPAPHPHPFGEFGGPSGPLPYPVPDGLPSVLYLLPLALLLAGRLFLSRDH